MASESRERECSEAFAFRTREKDMDTSFKPYKKWMVSVLERYPCGRDPKKEGRGRPPVYYLCRCDCGKEFILTGDEVSRRPYSCGCKGRPDIKGPHSNEKVTECCEHTAIGMIKPERPLYCGSIIKVMSAVRYPKREILLTLKCKKTQCLVYIFVFATIILLKGGSI